MKFTILITTYLLILAKLVDLGGIHEMSFSSIVLIICVSIVYSGLVLRTQNKLRKFLIFGFIILAGFISLGNIVYFYMKDAIFTISQLSLLNELVGVKETVLENISPPLIVAIAIPIFFCFAANHLAKLSTDKFSNKILYSCLAVITLTNVVFYNQDSLLYTTVYSPVAYSQKFGFLSFYARDLMPFTKVKLDDSKYDNHATKPAENDYSNLFADKTNVVMVTAESFDDIVIDPKLTPTLYKMKKDGIFFDNYYTLSTNTNASEFSILSSVSPPLDISHIENFEGEYTSIPDLFNDNNFCTFGFHMNSGKYYSRDELYPDLYHFDHSYFSEQLFDGDTLSINELRDEKLFESSLQYIKQANCDKNFTYYMSIFGHLPYDLSTRESARKDYEYVSKLYPDNDVYLNTYLAFQMSLDKMFSEMIEYYKDQGILDQTLFIVLGDHYPYALGNIEHPYGEYSQDFVDQSFSGEPYESYNVPFMIYDPAAKHEDNQEYMSNIDVMPTIADLFGFDYQFAEGKSAFDNSRPGVIKWLGTENFGMLSKDFVYVPGESNQLTAEQAAMIEDDKKKAAKLYSLF